jgi:hypothetical protein
MIRHGRYRQLDPLLALPVERLMIGVFLGEDRRQQARKALRDHMEQRGALTGSVTTQLQRKLTYSAKKTAGTSQRHPGR